MSMKARSVALCLALLAGGCAPAAHPEKPAQVAQPAAQPPSRPAPRSDLLGATVTERIRALDPGAFRAVTAMAVGGRVMLTGAVVKPEQRRRAEHAATAVDGVTGIRDELLLAEERAFDLFIPDATHQSALIARLAADGRTGRGDLDLRVVNNIAYVVASARAPDEIARIREILTEDAGIKWIVADVVP